MSDVGRIVIVVAALAVGLQAASAAERKVVRAHWFVSGQVQGVGFRAFTYEAATELKVRGWVRNLTDRRVEIVAEGDEAAVAALLAKVKKGPQFGRVEKVAEGKVDAGEKLGEKFEIRDSAVAPKD
jgi:acylphosphatase